MAIQAHVEELNMKHRRLEQDIESEYQRPDIDQARLSELKRRKLRIKDEILRLQESDTP